jgi:hypothetical protein
MVWQVQQLVQAATQLLASGATAAPADSAFHADAVATQRTSLGLQLLNLPALEWPEPAVMQSKQGAEEAMNVEVAEPETDDSTGQASTEETSTENVSDDDISKNEDTDEERSAINQVPAEVSEEAEEAEVSEEAEAEAPAQNDASEDIGADDADGDEEQNAKRPAPSESTVAAAASIPVEPEQPGEEQKSTALDPEIRQVDSAAGGSTKNHREQAESSGGEESEPDQPSEPTPGGL